MILVAEPRYLAGLAWLAPANLNQQLPILPGRFQPSTFGVYELNYCVRDGNRWFLVAIVTEFVRVFPENYIER